MLKLDGGECSFVRGAQADITVLDVLLPVLLQGCLGGLRLSATKTIYAKGAYRILSLNPGSPYCLQAVHVADCFIPEYIFVSHGHLLITG